MLVRGCRSILRLDIRGLEKSPPKSANPLMEAIFQTVVDFGPTYLQPCGLEMSTSQIEASIPGTHSVRASRQSDQAARYIKIGIGRKAFDQKQPENPKTLAKELVRQCLAEMNFKSHPPKLFVLWITPPRKSFAEAEERQVAILEAQKRFFEELMGKIQEESACKGITLAQSDTEDSSRGEYSVPLIGTTAAACVFDGKAEEQSAILLCLASKYLRVVSAQAELKMHLLQAKKADAEPLPVAKMAAEDFFKYLGEVRKHEVGVGASSSPGGTQDAPKQAELNSSKAELGPGGINPLNNQWLMLYVPAYSVTRNPLHYLAADITEALVTQTYGRIPMFGGGSCGGLEPAPGFQFHNGSVLQSHVVGALVESELAFGIGLSHGLKETGAHFIVKDLDDDQRTIRGFFGAESLPDVYENVMPQAILGLQDIGSATEHSGEPYFTAIVPKWPKKDSGEEERDRLITQRRIQGKIRLQKMVADPAGMEKSAEARRARLQDANGLHAREVRGILGIGCVCRFREREKLRRASTQGEPWSMESAIGDWMKRSLKDSPAQPVACFLDGEIGLDDTDRVRFNNFSYSELLLADAIPPQTRLRLAAKAIAGYALNAKKTVVGHEVEKIRPLEYAINMAFDCIEQAGFRGMMISLVRKNDNIEHVVGFQARGLLWAEKVLVKTIRPTPDDPKKGEDDILLMVQPGAPRFVHDAEDPQYGCDIEIARAAKILSFYACALHGPEYNKYGTLQIDLGNKTKIRLHEDYRGALNALGAVVSSVIYSALKAEEDELYRNLSNSLLDVIKGETTEEALSTFCRQISTDLSKGGANVSCHIRFLEGKDKLVLRYGHGEYFEALRAADERLEIDINADHGAAAKAFKRRDPSVCVNHPGTCRLWARKIAGRFPAPESEDKGNAAQREARLKLRHALDSIQSFANFTLYSRVGDEKVPSGMLCLMSDTPWFFGQVIVSAFEKIADRVGGFYALRKEIDLANASLQNLNVDVLKSRITYLGLQYLINAYLHPQLEQQVQLAEDAKTIKKRIEEYCRATRTTRSLADQAMTRGRITVQQVINTAIDMLSTRVNREAFDLQASTDLEFCGYKFVFETGLSEILLNAVEAAMGHQVASYQGCPPGSVKIRVSGSQRTIRVTNKFQGCEDFSLKRDLINETSETFYRYLDPKYHEVDPFHRFTSVRSSKPEHISVGILQIIMASTLNNCRVRWDVDKRASTCSVSVTMPPAVTTP